MLFFKRLPGFILKNRTISCVLFFVLIFFIYTAHEIGFFCMHNDVTKITNNLCKKYLQGDTSGNLCHSLCKNNAITEFSCTSQYAGKKMVFTAVWNNQPIVLKLAKDLDKSASDLLTHDQFVQNVEDIVKNSLNLSLTKETLRKLTTVFDDSKNLNSQQYRDLLTLFNSREYLLGKIFDDRDIFPQILGNCGPLYGVEFVPNVVFGDDQHDWLLKIKFAILIMDLIEEFETRFPDPLHVCDMKINHFGMDSMGRVKYLDADSVYPNSLIQRLMSDEKNCLQHEDCDIFDCKSNCNEKTHQCNLGLVNNNLQVLCEKLFVGWTLSRKMIVPGLLINELTPSSLATLIRQCSDIGRNLVPEETRQRLYTMLTEMDQILTDAIS